MLERALRRLATAHYNHVLSRSMVASQDAPAAVSGQDDAIRVLVLGSGVTSGLGVRTYGLALVGSLQRELQQRLSCPVDVFLVRQHGAGIEQAARLARTRAGEEWDAYIVAFGVSDALRYLPGPRWADGLGRLLATIQDVKVSPFRVPVVVAGIPPLASFEAHRGLLMPLLTRHGDRLNDLTRSLLARNDSAFFAGLPGMLSGRGSEFGSHADYDSWALVLAERLVPLLEGGVRRMTTSRSLHSGAELATRLLDPSNAPVRERLRALVGEASERLQGDFATIRLVDGDVFSCIVDSVGSLPRTTPLNGSIGSMTLAEGHLLVEDLDSDPRFAAAEQPVLHGIHSYAGIALHDLHGSPIGTLCVFGGGAGAPEGYAALQRLAARIELELQTSGPGSSGSDRSSTSVLASEPAARLDDGLPVRAQDERLPSLARRARLFLHNPARLRREGRRLVAVPAHRPEPRAKTLELPGPDPIRLLMIGGEYAVGFGVDSRKQALDGAMARLLHRSTGRGVRVVNAADPSIPLMDAHRHLERDDLREFDLIIWAPSFADAAKLLLRTRWLTGLSRLLRRADAESNAGVVLMALIGRVRARQINQVMRVAAARFPRARVAVPAPVVLAEVDTVDGAAVYRESAVSMFCAVEDALHSALAVRVSEKTEGQDRVAAAH